MERKEFLRGLGLVGIGTLAIPIINACSKDDDSSDSSTGTDSGTDSGSGSGSGSSSGSCSVHLKLPVRFQPLLHHLW